jgi:alcohol dehydrogenase (cytochrome c)
MIKRFPSTLLLFSFASCCAAQSTDAGLFTQAQSDEGRRAYAATCSACHGTDLVSTTAPPLTGPAFAGKWAQGRTVGDLFEVIRTTMPPGGGGTLPSDRYAAILAYLLQRNGFSAGPNALTPERVQQVRMRSNTPAAEKPPAPQFVPGSAKSAPAAGAGPLQAELNAAGQSTRDWLYHNHDYSGSRYVALDQINAGNVKKLQVACAFQMGDLSTFQTGPIVYRGTMFVTTQHATVALDAGTCKPKWRYNWEPKDREVWFAQRGVAIKDGRVVRGTNDGYLMELNAETGELIWARKVADTKQGETFTMAPLIFDDLILIGPAGSENGISGWVGAFRLEDGSEVWRFKTVPGAREGGTKSWGNPSNIVLGGGSVWTPFSLDPEKGELYVAVTNPAPDLPAHLRPGDNLYTNSMVVLNVRTGKLLWHKQMIANDSHDYDLTQVSPLFRTKIAGHDSSLVATVGKDGILRTVDRNSREVLYKAEITTVKNADVPVTTKASYACPGVLGGVEWNGPAYSPVTNMLYVGAVDWCSTFTSQESVKSGNFFGGTAPRDANSQGWVTAVDATTGEAKWKYRSSRPVVAAVTATAGNLVFAGELTGDFTALDARTGAALYKFNTGGPLGGGIVSYEHGGKQFVAAMSGRPSPFWVDQNPGAATVFVFSLGQ